MSPTASVASVASVLAPPAAAAGRDRERRVGTLGLLLSQVLDGPLLTFVGAAYYARLAEHVSVHDPATLDIADALVSRVRAMYRSQREHALVSALVPFVRSESPRVRAALDRDCAICLKPLRGPQRLVRLRAAGDDAAGTCGHFFHAECHADYEACPTSRRLCPLCRAGLSFAVWEDHESDRPRF